MAMKPEAKINARLKLATDTLIHSGVQAHRIEVRTGLGWPDWMLFQDEPNSCVMIESKWVYSWEQPLARWEPHQRSFARRKLAIGVPFYLLIGDEEKTLLLPAEPHLDSRNVDHIVKAWGTTIDPIGLQSVLTRPR
tara:strand:+ start:20924 stop:21331 length:408 start_codon:yes stop_codon:yes gene_type:complete